MKKFDLNNRIIFFLGLGGTLFAGYLTLTKLFTGSCALNEGCPYLFGYPTCLYGFVMFATILILSAIIWFSKKKDKQKLQLMKTIWGVSLFGILFAGYYSYIDIFQSTCPPEGCNYSLLLPSCVYGFFFYIAVFVVSNLALCKKK